MALCYQGDVTTWPFAIRVMSEHGPLLSEWCHNMALSYQSGVTTWPFPIRCHNMALYQSDVRTCDPQHGSEWCHNMALSYQSDVRTWPFTIRVTKGTTRVSRSHPSADGRPTPGPCGGPHGTAAAAAAAAVVLVIEAACTFSQSSSRGEVCVWGGENATLHPSGMHVCCIKTACYAGILHYVKSTYIAVNHLDPHHVTLWPRLAQPSFTFGPHLLLQVKLFLE